MNERPAIRGGLVDCHPSDLGRVSRLASILPCGCYAIANQNVAYGGNGSVTPINAAAGSVNYHLLIFANNPSDGYEIEHVRISTGTSSVATGGSFAAMLYRVSASNGGGWQISNAQIPRTPATLPDPQGLEVRFAPNAVAGTTTLASSVIGGQFQGRTVLWSSREHGGPIVLRPDADEGIMLVTRTLRVMPSDNLLSVCARIRTPTCRTTRYA